MSDRVGGQSFKRRPQEVIAIRYTGTNYGQVIDFVNDRSFFVEETMISGPRPLRGMQKAVIVRNVRMSVGVPVGHWLLSHDDDDDQPFTSLSDEQFVKDYIKEFPA